MYGRKQDENRILLAEKKAKTRILEARMNHKQEQQDALDLAIAAGCLFALMQKRCVISKVIFRFSFRLL